MFEKFKNFFSPSEEKKQFSHLKPFLLRAFFILCLCYPLAGMVSSSLLPTLIRSVEKAKSPVLQESTASVAIKNQVNFHEIRKAIFERNVFNQTGEYPVEESDTAAKKKESFDKDAPCEKSTLKLTLLGMIYLEGDKRSIATMKEEGYETADVYSVGDYVIGNDSAQIVDMQREKVVINNAGRKECLELKLGSEKLMAAVGGPKQVSEETINVEFESKWVENELGEGFGKVIQSARLVPNTVENRVNGYKIFAIQPGTLLDKAGFRDNDVITQVNNTVMEAEQGFALYQALLDEKQIRVNLLRDGKSPKTIIIKVK